MSHERLKFVLAFASALLLLCTVSDARDHELLPFIARAENSTNFLSNMHNAVSPAMFPIATSDAVAAHLDLNWAKMANFSHLVANGGSPQWIASSGPRLTIMELTQWVILKSAMRVAFQTDYAATFFNVKKGMWATCASFSSTGYQYPVTFCASNMALDLPIPCRAPEQSIDYITVDENSPSMYEKPTARNVATFSCSASEVGVAQMKARLITDSKKPLSTITGWSARDSYSGEYEQDFEVTYQSSEEPDCDRGACNDCYQGCCNSGYSSSSPYCRSDESRACY